ncbi:hypothetical protein AAG570_009101 [Ranatra chinensis]|uniref:SHSP domain-containing protein n=1 Tax=Ranatra chinensis TaxID=642074 RepID=A0ABD0YSS0_9HEMI
MSLLSYLLSDTYGTPNLYDQHFAQGLTNDDLVAPPKASPSPFSSVRPLKTLIHSHCGVSNVKSDKDGFKVSLDVQQFKPEELKVKVIDDYLVVEGKHQERQDQHGFVSRQFTRRYKLPNNIDHATIISSLSTDGVLMLYAPKKVNHIKL